MKKTFKIISVTLVVALLGASALLAAQNFVHASGYVAYLNPAAALSSGQLVDLGNRYGVCLVDIASNATGTVKTDGVWKFERATTNAVSAGANLYYSTADAVTDSATNDTYVGQCATSVDACLDLTNSLGDVDQFIEVDLNAPQRQCIIGIDVQAYSAE